MLAWLASVGVFLPVAEAPGWLLCSMHLAPLVYIIEHYPRYVQVIFKHRQYSHVSFCVIATFNAIVVEFALAPLPPPSGAS